MYKKICIYIKTSLMFVPGGLIGNKSSLEHPGNGLSTVQHQAITWSNDD